MLFKEKRCARTTPLCVFNTKHLHGYGLIHTHTQPAIQIHHLQRATTVLGLSIKRQSKLTAQFKIKIQLFVPFLGDTRKKKINRGKNKQIRQINIQKNDISII
jgi:hypothetical protein